MSKRFGKLLGQEGARSLRRMDRLGVHVIEVPKGAEEAFARRLARHPHVKAAEVDDEDLVLVRDSARGLLQGRTLALAGAQPGAKVRAYGPEGFLGLAQWQDDGRLAARRLIATGDPGNDASA